MVARRERFNPAGVHTWEEGRGREGEEVKRRGGDKNLQSCRQTEVVDNLGKSQSHQQGGHLEG